MSQRRPSIRIIDPAKLATFNLPEHLRVRAPRSRPPPPSTINTIEPVRNEKRTLRIVGGKKSSTKKITKNKKRTTKK